MPPWIRSAHALILLSTAPATPTMAAAMGGQHRSDVLAFPITVKPAGRARLLKACDDRTWLCASHALHGLGLTNTTFSPAQVDVTD